MQNKFHSSIYFSKQAKLTNPPGNLLNLRATEKFVDSHIQTSTTRSLRKFRAIRCVQKFVFVYCQSAYRNFATANLPVLLNKLMVSQFAKSAYKVAGSKFAKICHSKPSNNWIIGNGFLAVRSETVFLISVTFINNKSFKPVLVGFLSWEFLLKVLQTFFQGFQATHWTSYICCHFCPFVYRHKVKNVRDPLHLDSQLG